MLLRKILLNLLLLISILYSINHYIGQYDKDYKNKCLNKFSVSLVSVSSAIINNVLDKSKMGELAKEDLRSPPVEKQKEVIKKLPKETKKKELVKLDLNHKKIDTDSLNQEFTKIYPTLINSRKSNEKKNFLGNIYIFENEKIPKNIKYEKLKRKYPKDVFNLSVSVFLNALNISFTTLLHKPFGWGLNMYEYAFDLYMFDERVYPYHYHEVFTLNYNDGSANIPKLITEFGLFSFILIPIFFIFLFSKKISPQNKIFFGTLILTQLLRGAGYFNGGFGFSIIFMCFTVFNFYNKKS